MYIPVSYTILCYITVYLYAANNTRWPDRVNTIYAHTCVDCIADHSQPNPFFPMMPRLVVIQIFYCY